MLVQPRLSLRAGTVIFEATVAAMGFVVPLVLVFFYGGLYNRTQSILLCILLHASFTAAQDHLLLITDSRIVDAVLPGTSWRPV